MPRRFCWFSAPKQAPGNCPARTANRTNLFRSRSAKPRAARSLAQREASRALGRAACAHHATPFAVCEQTIPVYWNTPAHLHFELIFRFDIPETADLNPVLPRGAQWFTLPDAARLDSESRVRLVRKTQPLFQGNHHL